MGVLFLSFWGTSLLFSILAIAIFISTNSIVSQFSRSVMSDSLWPHGLQHVELSCPSPTLGLAQLMSIELVMPSNCLILISLLLLLSVFPCIRVFSNESLHIRWPKYWSFSFSISPSNEYLGLISWRIDWVWSPCCPRDSQEYSPIPWFKSINSSALSFH